MKAFVLSLVVGGFIGVLYALVRVRSPAPPAVALIGLLGILCGEQVSLTAMRVFAGEPFSVRMLFGGSQPADPDASPVTVAHDKPEPP